jgi:hypothetical protein
MFLFIDIALFFNSYVNPVALDALNWKYYIVYDVWLFIELVVVYFFYIETRNTPLEEIVKYFDGDMALLGGDLATDKARQILAEEGIGSHEDTKQVTTTGTAELDIAQGEKTVSREENVEEKNLS